VTSPASASQVARLPTARRPGGRRRGRDDPRPRGGVVRSGPGLARLEGSLPRAPRGPSASGPRRSGAAAARRCGILTSPRSRKRCPQREPVRHRPLAAPIVRHAQAERQRRSSTGPASAPRLRRCMPEPVQRPPPPAVLPRSRRDPAALARARNERLRHRTLACCGRRLAGGRSWRRRRVHFPLHRPWGPPLRSVPPAAKDLPANPLGRLQLGTIRLHLDPLQFGRREPHGDDEVLALFPRLARSSRQPRHPAPFGVFDSEKGSGWDREGDTAPGQGQAAMSGSDNPARLRSPATSSVDHGVDRDVGQWR